jgi:hypothetical protein
MVNPTPIRKQEVFAKLDYANHRHQQLMGEMVEAKRQKQDPAFLVHSAADIISAVRECFDYLGQDIIECYIVPNTQIPKVRTDYATGKLKAYFPYYEPQVMRTSSVFFELKKIAPALFQALLDFTRSIDSGSQIPDTLFTYQMLVEVKDMVNEKKHDKLIGVVSEGGQEFLIESKDVTVLIPIKGQSGWSSFSVMPGSRVSNVTEYRFEHNNQEVSKFCLFSMNATRRVISEFYDSYFA